MTAPTSLMPRRQTMSRAALACKPAALALAVLATLSGSAGAADSIAQDNERYRQALYLRETGQPYAAIESLEALLAASPTLNRARLELAVAYYRTLEFNKARAQVQSVIDDPQTPEAVRLSALSFLKKLEVEQASLFGQPHRLDASVSLGLLYDDNVTAGPTNALLPNGLVLTPGSLKDGDWGAVAQGTLTHTWTRSAPVRLGQSGAGRFSWVSQLGLYHKAYSDLDDYNLSVLTVATGPALLTQGGVRANLNLQVDQLRLGDENLGRFTTLSPSVALRVGQGELTIDGQWSHRDFQRSLDSGRSGYYRALSLSYGHLLSNGRLALQGGLTGFAESAQAEQHSNEGIEAFAGARLRAWDGGDLFARAAWRQARYDGLVPTFDEARREIERRAELGASHLFATGPLDKWQLSGTVTYIRNSANVELYTYDRTITSITLARSF
ncbi:MAG: tetratricopeptide repeat protein [Pseudomonadota bacterium]